MADAEATRPLYVCFDCGRATGHGHARGCEHPAAKDDRRDVEPAWLSPASNRRSTESLRATLGKAAR